MHAASSGTAACVSATARAAAMATQRRLVSQGSHASEFSDLAGYPLSQPLTATHATGDNAEHDGRAHANDSNCLRQHLRSPCARACWVIASFSITINVVVASLMVYFYLLTSSGGGTNPPLPPASNANCTLAHGEELQAVQLNSTTMRICWTTVNVTSTRETAPYVLRLSDWFSDTQSYIAYSGTNNSVVIYDLIPHVTYNISLERCVRARAWCVVCVRETDRESVCAGEKLCAPTSVMANWRAGRDRAARPRTPA